MSKILGQDVGICPLLDSNGDTTCHGQHYQQDVLQIIIDFL